MERIHGEQTRQTKAQPGGGTVDKYGNMGAGASEEPLEDKTDYNGPFDWRHPFKTFGKGEKPAGASGMIKVKLKSTGQTGSVSPDKFDPSLYDKIQ
jgi:hypothetical protein